MKIIVKEVLKKVSNEMNDTNEDLIYVDAKEIEIWLKELGSEVLFVNEDGMKVVNFDKNLNKLWKQEA